MSQINHGEMVRVLCKSGETIAMELTANDAHLIHMVMGISGEAGELLDAVKKATVYRKDIDRQNVIEELGDIEFYMEGLRQGMGITREETLLHNISKLGKRYEGFKYSNDAAQARADKQEGYIRSQAMAYFQDAYGNNFNPNDMGRVDNEHGKWWIDAYSGEMIRRSE